MAKAEVVNWTKKKVGEVELPDSVFATEVRTDLLHTIVKWQLASRRQGTHMAKNRSLVSGGGKKPFKQKGTGNARQGSTRSPLLKGGGVIFGPTPRDYSYTVPKKVKKAAMKSALAHLYKEGRFYVVEDMTSSDGKANELAKRLKGFGVNKALLIDNNSNDLFLRAARNLPGFRYNTVEGLNVYDLLKYDAAIVTRDSIEKIVERCGEGQ
jgi:large subunit ribosomal protein L4